MAGGTCLGLIARTVGDDIVPLVLPFIEENITKPDWRQREAATYAFGSILEGPSPDKLTFIVNVALNFMLSALVKDPNNHVKGTTAWTVGRIFELLHDKACGALYFLIQGYKDVSSLSPITPFFQDIVQALPTVIHREDAGESHLRTAAYETLNEVVRCSKDETAPRVVQLIPVIMRELHKTLEAQKRSSDEKEKQNELQGLLCGCLQVIIQKLGSSEPTKYVFVQHADQMMGLLLRVFACRSATVHEEAMLAIGALAYATGPDFSKYMQDLYKYFEKGLQNFEYQLLKDLSSYQLHRSVKPPIFSCFGDIALAIGENFEKYFMYVMPMLQSAAELSARTSDADDEIIEDVMLSKTAIGVLGDLADTLGSNAVPLIQQSMSSKDFLNECLSSDHDLIKESAEWDKLAIVLGVKGIVQMKMRKLMVVDVMPDYDDPGSNPKHDPRKGKPDLVAMVWVRVGRVGAAGVAGGVIFAGRDCAGEEDGWENGAGAAGALSVTVA
ncbi:hypothetical protein HHK36_000051 [Tetracentron sinense]|uniref:Importin subunit beta-1/Transportin-1-like TPR repeats domain-containing protein n=1 Tax=Tetracentron sinense TaxID=13715 RepID=A0A835DQH1_TETSI|nr:hypothetical protein HHK36_000051 [Tetracentron sinense]